MVMRRRDKIQFRVSERERLEAEYLKDNDINISNICRKAIREEYLKNQKGIGKFKVG